MPPRPTKTGGAAVGCALVVSGLPKMPPVPVGAKVLLPPRRKFALKGCAVAVVVVVLKFRLAAVVACGLLKENAPTPAPSVAGMAVDPKAGGAVVGALVVGVEKLNEGATVAVAAPKAGAAADAPKAGAAVGGAAKADDAADAPKADAPGVAPTVGVAVAVPKAGAALNAPKAGAALAAPNAGAGLAAPKAGAVLVAPKAGAALAAPKAGAVVVLPKEGSDRPVPAGVAAVCDPKLSVGAALAAAGAKLKFGAEAPTTAPAAPARLDVAVAAPNAGGGALVAGRAPKLKAAVAGAVAPAPRPAFVVGVPNEKDIV